MTAQGDSFSIRLLQPQDIDDVKRLHKYATQAGRPVFAQYGEDAAAVLEAAAAGVAGTFGLALLAADPEVPGEEPELVGALTAQAEQQQQQQGGGDLVLLTLVVRADVRQQGAGRSLVQALLAHARQVQASGQPCSRLVTDIALSNKPAWQFFTALGFRRGAAHGATAEAWLALEAAGNGNAAEPPQAGAAPPAAAAALPSRCSSSMHGACYSTGCSSSSRVLQRWQQPAARHVRLPVCLSSGRHRTAATRMRLSVMGVQLLV